jgi:hypothetical protein
LGAIAELGASIEVKKSHGIPKTTNFVSLSITPP